MKDTQRNKLKELIEEVRVSAVRDDITEKAEGDLIAYIEELTAKKKENK